MSAEVIGHPTAVEESAAVEHGGMGWGEPGGRMLLKAVAFIFSAFQIYTAAYASLPSSVVRSLHVGFLLLLLFGLTANRRRGDWTAILWAALAVVAFVAGLYHWIFYADLIQRAGLPTEMDLAVGVLVVALVFLAGFRLMGPSLPLICLVFLLYGLYGEYLPPPLDHRPFGYDQIIDTLYLGTEGIYGTPTYVSSTYIFLFILFGAFLERAGMISLFTDVALGTVGHTRGGPAKVAVVASAFMGTISGSGVANVVAVGQFTIPLMKRFGFRAAFAGGVEATASMGGQIMPPVMGAVAFIMAESLGIPYLQVVEAAIVPAILYFMTAFWMVHLEAGRLGLLGVPKEQCPNALAALRKGWFLLLPLGILVYLLLAGYTPLYAGTIGLGLTAMIVLGAPIALGMGAAALRIAFWIALGLMSAAFLAYGIGVVIAVVALLVLINAVRKGGRETLKLCGEALADGARQALPVGIACALVGVIIGVLSLTGSATTFAGAVVAVGQNSLFASLLLTMLICLILGMGIPTIPNYIITSSIAGPALLQLGVPLLVSHMFVFYFGIMADLTPPVALAAFAAAPIARESGMKIGLQAMRVAIAGFAVPFMAVYAPVLMLQDGGPLAESIGYTPAVLYVLLKAVVAIGLWGATAVGFLLGPIRLWERAWAFIAAVLLVAAVPLTDTAGFIAAAAFIAWHLWSRRSAGGAATAGGRGA
ncbi:TRAP transporter permease [Roseomonas sp. E05]|uniref:TRAP transporter permease n=1 Tax=Roseomonas sp. E05 TaxID=3046310 RepID=UPI0024BB4E2C|nr:TRAP transporter permease [Roseomonas sp. E05]MDJ0387391.1 TRAP transporter permease [Roseomonas sp. E05]